jgi:hypothetical protein
MLEKLQKKWNVDPWRLFLILLTFAVGGSLAGFMAKKVMGFIPLDAGILWTILYIVVVTLLWPLSVYSVSILTGQFRFFSSYLKRMAIRMKLMKEPAEVKE